MARQALPRSSVHRRFEVHPPYEYEAAHRSSRRIRRTPTQAAGRGSGGLPAESRIRIRNAATCRTCYGRLVEKDYWDSAQAVNWSRYMTPTGRGGGPAHSVLDALRRIDQAQDSAAAEAAYHFTLDAVGHNHSGWLYPAVVPAAPFLLRLATGARTWGRLTALEVLTDVLNWLPDDDRAGFDPGAVRRAIDEAQSQIELLASADSSEPVRLAAATLIADLAEGKN